MNLSTQIKAFAANDMDLFKLFQDYWNHWSVKNLGRKADYSSVHTLDEKNEMINKALIATIAKRSRVPFEATSQIGSWYMDPMVKYHTYAVIGALVDMILPQTMIDSIGLYTDIRFGGFGDSFAFDVEPQDLFVVSKAGRAKRNSEVRRQFKGQVTVIPENHQLTAAVSLYRVLAGKVSLADLTLKIIRSLETEITRDTYDTFETAMDAADQTATTGLYVAGYTQASLVRLCQQVQAWNQGAKPVIVGTQLALVNVLPDDANYRYTLDDPYMKLGYVKTAFGFDTMVLPQVANWQTQFGTNVISDSRLWIISPSSQKLIKLCFEGQTIAITDNPLDNADLTQKTTFGKMWKSSFASNAVAGVMTV